LTPYSVDSNNVPAPRKARAGSVSYRNWVGLVVKNTDGESKAKVQRLPALVVERFTARSKEVSGKRTSAQLWGFGYDMEHMRARCWFEGRMPMHAIPDEQVSEKYALNSERMVKAAIEIARYLSSSLKDAWFPERSKVRGDTGFVGEAFWSRSEPGFFMHLDRLIRELEASDSVHAVETLKSWHRILWKLSLDLFDEYVTSGPIEVQNPSRIAVARNKLKNMSRGKGIRAILSLPDEPKKRGSSQTENTGR
jgi:CRISPR system Cascade subunit CasA